VLNRERYFEDRMEDSIHRMARSARFKMLANKVVAPTTEFVGIVGLLGLVFALFMLEWPSDKIIVTLSLFVIGLVRLRQALNAILQQYTNLRYNLVSVNPVYDDLIRLRDLNRDQRTARPKRGDGRKLNDKVELKGVAYSYGADERYSLNGVDVEIPAGQAVAFVGPTGAGKSTLIDVLLGLLQPQEGAVYVDGEKLDRENLPDWQTRIGYVPQSIYLLDDSIRRNIALGLTDEEIDEDAVRLAARKAQLDTFLDRQPHGLDTVIGEGGVRLSGGERQRIGIARALYHDPEVLILDEATSSLDNETERAVVSAVEAEKGQRTIVMIAHRLSTVRNCHVLYYLKNGKVEASGDFEELQRRSADFRNMAEGAELRASA
jgi:ATP-binding cassette subfamily C protein